MDPPPRRTSATSFSYLISTVEHRGDPIEVLEAPFAQIPNEHRHDRLSSGVFTIQIGTNPGPDRVGGRECYFDVETTFGPCANLDCCLVSVGDGADDRQKASRTALVRGLTTARLRLRSGPTMMIEWYLLSAGTLRRQPVPTAWPTGDLASLGESWFDIRDADPDGLRAFLKLNLHPLALDRCIAPANVPGVISFGQTVLLEFPAGQSVDASAAAYLTLVLQGTVLLTIRRDSMPAVDALAQSLVADGAQPIYHLAQIVYELLDTLADPGVQAEIELRDQLQQVSRALAEMPGSVSATDLTRLHWRIGTLVSLIENQLYSVAALNASDNEALREPHRKAYIQDLVSELELAQRGVERLEARGNDLDAAFQLASSSRLERRLRVLTVISAVTLPLGLLAGLLGMNVGGVPGITDSDGFVIVVLLMATIVAAELLYFRMAGWLD